MDADLPEALRRIVDASSDPVAARRLVTEALTHRTWANEHPEAGSADNQRLELLGDSVLGLVVTRALFEALPSADEGLLSRARASVVNEAPLAAAARALDLGPLLRLGRGEEGSGGRDRARTLADAMEALIAAIYLAAGIEAARGLVEESLGAPIAEAVRAATTPPASARGVDARVKDAKSVLQELVQRRGGDPPSYQLEATDGPVHERLFRVRVDARGVTLGRGEGRSRREAEMRAAGEALAAIEQNPTILDQEP
jgi:ribonuclease-3